MGSEGSSRKPIQSRIQHWKLAPSLSCISFGYFRGRLFEKRKSGREDIKITVVENVDEVLKIALKNELKRVEWTEVENISKSEKDQKSQASIQ